MGRTKQTARMSTGGKAVRAVIEARVELSRKRRLEDANAAARLRDENEKAMEKVVNQLNPAVKDFINGGLPKPDLKAFYARKVVTKSGKRYYGKARPGDHKDYPIELLSEEDIDSSASDQ